MAESHKLIVGARDWNHQGWSGVFYPEDLPEDWRLSYYANEFMGVLLPETVWRAVDPSVIVDWCDDVTDGFLFYLEASSSQLSEQLAATYGELFGSHWGGVPVADGALMSADEKWDLRQLRVRFDGLIDQPGGVAAPAFFIYGNPPDIAHLREARLLADML